MEVKKVIRRRERKRGEGSGVNGRRTRRENKERIRERNKG